MNTRYHRHLSLQQSLLAILAVGFFFLWASREGSAADASGVVPVRIQTNSGKHQLLRDGQAYFIKGAGGGGSKEVLAECGGNSFRTWGIGPETEAELDAAHKLGLTVTVGIWIGHKQHGFNYDDPAAVRRQFEEVKKGVLKYKDHPAVLMWGLGNEMEMNNESPALWKAIQDLAAMVHEVDPQHPTMTVIAELGADKVQQIHQHCPDIDVIGINSYGGGSSLADRYLKSGGTKPIVITEYGPPGTWEIPLNAFDAAPEMTSTQKAKSYREVYEKSVLGAKGICLGSYAFTWGHKIEATATWFGMFLPDGSRLAAVDVMQELWSGKPPQHPCPKMQKLTLTSKDQVQRGETVTAEVLFPADHADEIKIEWALYREQQTYGVEGTGSKATPSFPDAIVENGQGKVSVEMPQSGGVYRLYCTLRNAHGGAAVGSLPINVLGARTLIKAAVPELPLIVYGDGQKGAPFAPSGWMGNVESIKMEEDCEENPHSGKTCLKVSFTQSGGWGSVAWQHPPNDWGHLPGGYDLSKAEKCVFWARGKQGGEKLVFGMGMIGIDQKYHDSCKTESEITLTQDWKQYTLDLGEKELIRIKTGFLWRIANPSHATEFYLDDIEYR